ncbi:MAG TPA: TIR domain-containing protein [Pyrinomonadaceae bacterium]|nr:TIR domain-containing protein [Pyrinomonadaceae bacterium]
MSRSNVNAAGREEAPYAPVVRGFAPDERAPAPLRLLHPSEVAPPRLTLPTLATAGDVREAVQYLKKKPSGVSVAEALDDVKRRVFEPRKVAAYEAWGVVVRRQERLHLTPLGWEFARKLEPETEAYRALLDGSAPYRAALEWMHRDALELVTHTDVADFWLRLYGGALEREDERPVEANVLCFFHLCQAAELGTVTIGKRGQPARLRVERDELARHVGAERGQPAGYGAGEPSARETFPPGHTLNAGAPPRATGGERVRVFVSAGRETKILERLRTALELADIECRACARETAGAAFFPEAMSRAMRECEAAVIVATREDFDANDAGERVPGRSLLMQLGAAFVLYDRRVALLWAGDVDVPANLSELPHFTFEGDELTWETGVGLLKAVKDFQGRARHAA